MDRKFMTRGSQSLVNGSSITLGLVGLLGSGCVGLAIVFCGCGIPVVIVGKPVEAVVHKVEETHEHNKGPIPESEWNNLGLWYRISGQPPTYLPKGFGRDQARNDQTGTWFPDKRDGKRLFVPKGGANGLPEAVLAAEARNATNWKTRLKMEITPEVLIMGGDVD